MAGASTIEWTDATWNPIVGCSIVSPGCTNCYAMQMAYRIEAMSGAAGTKTHYRGTTTKVNRRGVWTGKVALASDKILTQPLRWRTPKRIFVNSMGDLFHESIPDEWIDRVFAVMALCPQHTFQVLTKRSERMRDYFDVGFSAMDTPKRAMHVEDQFVKLTAGQWGPPDLPVWPLTNVWLGVSAERQQEADERIPHLLDTPAGVRFLSAEPLLGRIDLHEVIPDPLAWTFAHGFNGLDWVIVGGESGSKARPMHPQWARDLRDQCQQAGVPFFFKQWGEYAPQFDECGGQHRAARVGMATHFFRRTEHFGTSVVRVGKKAAGRLLDGRTWDEFPTTPSQQRSAA